MERALAEQEMEQSADTQVANIRDDVREYLQSLSCASKKAAALQDGADKSDTHRSCHQHEGTIEEQRCSNGGPHKQMAMLTASINTFTKTIACLPNNNKKDNNNNNVEVMGIRTERKQSGDRSGRWISGVEITVGIILDTAIAAKTAKNCSRPQDRGHGENKMGGSTEQDSIGNYCKDHKAQWKKAQSI